MPRWCWRATRTPQPPARDHRAISQRLAEFRFNRYPDPTAHELRELIAEANGLEPENVLVGNGGDELIFDLLLAWGGPGRTLLDMPPTFSMYGIDAAGHRHRGGRAFRAARTSRSTRTRCSSGCGRATSTSSIIANPNNPTGGLHRRVVPHRAAQGHRCARAWSTRRTSSSAATRCARTWRATPTSSSCARSPRRSRSRGCAWATCSAHADVVRELMKVRQPYSVDSFSPVGGGDGLPRAHGVRAGDPRHHARARPIMHGLCAAGRRRGLPQRGELRALPRRARLGAVARPPPQPLGARSGLLAQPGLEDCLRVTRGQRARRTRASSRRWTSCSPADVRRALRRPSRNRHQ